jgi:hypothetical protein
MLRNRRNNIGAPKSVLHRCQPPTVVMGLSEEGLQLIPQEGPLIFFFTICKNIFFFGPPCVALCPDQMMALSSYGLFLTRLHAVLGYVSCTEAPDIEGPTSGCAKCNGECECILWPQGILCWKYIIIRTSSPLRYSAFPVVLLYSHTALHFLHPFCHVATSVGQTWSWFQTGYSSSRASRPQPLHFDYRVYECFTQNQHIGNIL